MSLTFLCYHLPPGISPPHLEQISDKARGDVSNVFVLTLTNHSGTHVDAPRHFVVDGLPIGDFEPAEFVFGRPVVCDVSLGDAEMVQPAYLAAHAERVATADLLLIRTGYAACRRDDPERYRTVSPSFSAAGARGALMFGPEGETEVPAYKVKVVDPTAAGDAFCGGLAVALARGQSIVDTVKYANAAGAYAVTVLGAEPSMPSAEQVERMLKGEAK